jgi:GT2 family glycosyltransferase
MIVVDNRSTDDTKKVIEDFAKTAPVPVKYVWEPRQGCSHARNAGFQQSSGEIVVFLDDDCHPTPDWLQLISDKFVADPNLGFLGGRVELFDPTDLPISIRQVYETAEFTNPAEHLTLIASCNLACRREAMARVGGFDPRLGPGSRRKLVADDFEFIYRAFRKGIKIVYFPDILVHHAHGRKDRSEFQKIMLGYVRGRGALWMKYALFGDVEALRQAYWFICATLRDRAKDRRAGNEGSEGVWTLKQFLLGGILYMERMLRERGEPQLR